MTAVRWIAEGTEIRIVRSFDAHTPAKSHQTVKLFHGANHVGDVFDDMNSVKSIEAPVGKWVWKMV